MAITLFCYVAQHKEEAQETLLRLTDDHGDLFNAAFLLSRAKSVADEEWQLASEYGFDSRSLFLMRLNQKDQIERMEEAENIVKSKFGSEKTLILWENELKH
jgi:hypothetical protein